MLLRAFQSIVENSPDAISLVDQQGALLFTTAAITKISGYRPETLIGKQCIDLIHADDHDLFLQSLEEVNQNSPGSEAAGSRQWECRVRHLDGNYHWVENCASNLLADTDVRAIVIYQRDISARKAAEEQSQRQADELISSHSRMEEFAYTVAHDLREPLRTISAYTRILLKNAQLDAAAQQMAEFVFAGVNRMSILITDLLTFAVTGKEVPIQPVDLGHAVSQALQNLKLEVAESGAQVTVDSLPSVLADETHVVRLVQNLISNALKYCRTSPPEIRVFAEPGHSNWVVKIRDNGPGIAIEYQTRIFMPFVRLANREVPGTGLGLAVCKRIAEGLGGSIWVESEVGVGSTFAFTLKSSVPAWNAAPAAVMQ